MSDEISREDLYARVWTTPMQKLAAEFGLSDVALSKRCKKLNIPTPSRGYWAKIDSGKKAARPLLPPLKEPTLEPPAESIAEVRWPREIRALDPRAQELHALLLETKPGYDGLLSVEQPPFPKIKLSKALMIEPAVRAFHGLVTMVEKSGILFRKARGKYYTGHFEFQGQRLYPEIEEITKTATGSAYTHYDGRRQKPIGTGKLKFTLKAEQYGRGGEKSWTEGENGTLREVVTLVAEHVLEHYRELEKKRKEDEERRRVEHERWLKEEEARKKTAHEQALDAARHKREDDLFRAIEWARIHREAELYFKECEQRWTAGGTVLSTEQQSWLTWARRIAEAWSPWALGYPDPGHDGTFERAAVQFGGPYPSQRNFPQPPTMPKIPSPTTDSYYSRQEEPPRYPFWLKHQR